MYLHTRVSDVHLELFSLMLRVSYQLFVNYHITFQVVYNLCKVIYDAVIPETEFEYLQRLAH